MGKNDIISELARERVVERMISNIFHRKLSADLEDLSQYVYLTLLDYPEEIIADLWRHKQMRFFIARIIWVQRVGKRSEYNNTFRNHDTLAENIPRE